MAWTLASECMCIPQTLTEGNVHSCCMAACYTGYPSPQSKWRKTSAGRDSAYSPPRSIAPAQLQMSPARCALIPSEALRDTLACDGAPPQNRGHCLNAPAVTGVEHGRRQPHIWLSEAHDDLRSTFPTLHLPGLLPLISGLKLRSGGHRIRGAAREAKVEALRRRKSPTLVD
jgi:hypothetical protein